MQEKKLSYQDNLDLWFLRMELESTRSNIVNLIDSGHILANKAGIQKFIETFGLLTEKFNIFYNSVKEHAVEILGETNNFIDYDINFITRIFKVEETELPFDLQEETLKVIEFNEDYYQIIKSILAGKDVL